MIVAQYDGRCGGRARATHARRRGRIEMGVDQEGAAEQPVRLFDQRREGRMMRAPAVSSRSRFRGRHAGRDRSPRRWPPPWGSCRAGGDAGGAVIERPGQGAFEHAGVELVGLRGWRRVGARESGPARKGMPSAGAARTARRRRHPRRGAARQRHGGLARKAAGRRIRCGRGNDDGRGLAGRQAAIQSVVIRRDR